jgi:response regulator of citrate/malate metabolism
MIDYQQVLSDLEARRDALVADLEASIRTVKQILRQSVAQLAASGDLQPGQSKGTKNNTRLVLDFLMQETPRSHTMPKIGEATGLDDKSVRRVVARLYKAKKIDRPSRGKYRGKPQPQATAAA